MRAGLLRYRLRIERPVVVDDAMRSPKKTWEPLGEWVYADIRAMSAREYFSATKRDVGAPTFQIIVRRVPGVKLDPSMRGIDLDNNVTFDFVAELPSARRDYWTFAAVSGKGAA
jgi:head-tail adaptor